MIIIPKANDDYSNYPCWVATETTDGRPLKPVIFCNCGKAFGLGNHSIAADGTVSPSFWHRDSITGNNDNLGCGFHEFIKCEGYNGAAFSKDQGNG